MSQACQDAAIENLASCATDGSMEIKQGCCSKDCSTGIKKVWFPACPCCQLLGPPVWAPHFPCVAAHRHVLQPTATPLHTSQCRPFLVKNVQYLLCVCIPAQYNHQLPQCPICLPQAIDSGCFNEYAVAICNDPKSQGMMTGLLNAGVRCADFTTTCKVNPHTKHPSCTQLDCAQAYSAQADHICLH